jgi:hypothetical protein
VDGVTTNPTIISKEGRDFKEVITEICGLVDGPVSAEVIALDTENMVKEAQDISTWADNIVVKIPMTEDGLRASKRPTNGLTNVAPALAAIKPCATVKTKVTLVLIPSLDQYRRKNSYDRRWPASSEYLI